MNSKHCVRKSLRILSLVSLLAVGLSSFAQEQAKKPDTTRERAKAHEGVATDVSLKPLVRFDADANNDGIADAVQSLNTVRNVLHDTKSSFHSTLEKDITKGFRNAQVLRRPKPKNTCFDYMMLSPEDKDKVNRRIQQQTGGVFGSRPCDPYVSDMIERPFENEYIELPIVPLGSIQGVVVK